MQNYDQTNLDEDSHYHKIKTPATLFSKSSGKSPINRLRTQPSNPTHLDSYCQNHQAKPATYFTQVQSQRLYFCQKCAITLASHGHSICKLSMGNNLFSSPNHTVSSLAASSRKKTQSISQLRQRREMQISGFIEQLRDMRGAVSTTKETIKEKLIESEEFYGEQLEQVNDYFSLVMKSLELQKHKCYNHILTERRQAQQHIRGIGNEVGSIDEGITKILMDIQDNLQTVYSIQQQMYKLVFSQYVDQQQRFQSSLNNLLLQPIDMRRIEFQGVPDSIYNISDLVIQNSIKNQEQHQYRLADSLTGEEFNHIRVVSPERQDQRVRNSNSNFSSLKFSFQAERLRGEQC